MANSFWSQPGCTSPCGCAGGLTYCTCTPCSIPQQNLTISWVNPLSGNGSDTLVYTSPCSWATGCSGGAGVGNQFIFKLSCAGGFGGGIDFRVYYFVSGSCPTGQSTYCGTRLASPATIVLASYTCGAGFSLNFTVSTMGCPVIAASGYTNFTITI